MLAAPFRYVANRQRVRLSCNWICGLKQYESKNLVHSGAQRRVPPKSQTHSDKDSTKLPKFIKSQSGSVSFDVTTIFDDDEQMNVDGLGDSNDDINNETDKKVHFIARSAVLTNFQAKLQRSNDFTLSHEEWRKLKEEACAENPNLKKSWETLCMQLSWQHGYPQLAASLIDYIHSSATPNLATLALYIALQSYYGAEDKEDVILKTYTEITNITDVFDSTISKYLIAGLSVTSKWRDTLDILEMSKFTASVGTSYYSPIIAAALRNCDQDLAFRLLDDLARNGRQPKDSVLLEVLRICKDSNSNTLLEKYFTYIWQYNWLPSPQVAKELDLHFTGSKQEEWLCRWTQVDAARGTCRACNHQLQRVEVPNDDFEALQRMFLQRALVGSNVYLKSNPQEVERFQDFVRKNAPFDIVLDALNIALKRGKAASVTVRSRQLRAMVNYFAQNKRMRVLVIGRAHMLKWPQGDMNSIRRHSKMFLTDNVSSDDPFCLYATLYSGKHCLFVSSDFMRDHKYSLGVHLKDVFSRWQKSRQILDFMFCNEGVLVKMPSQYDCGPVKDDKGWHLPYIDGNDSLKSTSQTVLCLRYHGQRRTSPESPDQKK